MLLESRLHWPGYMYFTVINSRLDVLFSITLYNAYCYYIILYYHDIHTDLYFASMSVHASVCPLNLDVQHIIYKLTLFP